MEGDSGWGHLSLFDLIVGHGRHVQRHDELVISTLLSGEDRLVEFLLGAEKNKLRVVVAFYKLVSLISYYSGGAGTYSIP